MPALSPKKILADAILGGLLVFPAGAASISPDAKAFIEKHCVECHDTETKKAGLDLSALQFDPNDKANFGIWLKVHDRVKAGEMPPQKNARPNPIVQENFVRSLASTLTASEKAIVAREGRAMQRRLNRYE